MEPPRLPHPPAGYQGDGQAPDPALGRVRVGPRKPKEDVVPTDRSVQLPSERWEKWQEMVDFARQAFTELLSRDEEHNYSKQAMESPQRFFEFVSKVFSPHLKRFGITQGEMQDLARHLHSELHGYGAMELYLKDPSVEDILVDSHDRMDIRKGGQMVRIEPTPFKSDHDVLSWLQTVVFNPLGKEFTRANPAENAVLNDGTRVFAFRDPIAEHVGFTLRKHKKEVFGTLEDYLGTGIAPLEFFHELDRWVCERRNIVISGATSAGKTTFLNFAAARVPHDQRILVLEDTPELQIQHPRVLPLQTYQKGARAAAEERDIPMYELLRHALRLAPDRIVIGECRGPETFVMLDALNTGHAGSFTTLHSNSPVDAITRLASMAKRNEANFPLEELWNLIAATIDLVVQIKFLEETGQRRVIGVAQVLYRYHYRDLEEVPDAVQVKENLFIRHLWAYDYQEQKLRKLAEFIPPDHG